MNKNSTRIVKAALSAAHLTGADGWLAPWTRGMGAILTLHRVTPDPVQPFDPNRILKITPAFLEDAIEDIRASGFDIVSMSEVALRLALGQEPGQRPFVAFTLDDGYRDNLEYAYPVFARHRVPFTVYVPTSFADGTGDLWWVTLERVIAEAGHVRVSMDGTLHRFDTRNAAEKEIAFDRIYWALRAMNEQRARAVVGELAASLGLDMSGQCRELVMGWDELRTLAADPLVTIGAHTERHLALSKLSLADATREITGSIARITAEFGKPCRHFSYPYGCARSAGPREFQIAQRSGLATATTTRKGVITSRHAKATTALPRISLNGDYQDMRYLRVLLSGAPFAALEAFGGSRA